jgi:hypothetical protein
MGNVELNIHQNMPVQAMSASDVRKLGQPQTSSSSGVDPLALPAERRWGAQ